MSLVWVFMQRDVNLTICSTMDEKTDESYAMQKKNQSAKG